MSKRDDFQLLEDMIESCERILQYTSGLNTLDESMVRDAVARNLEIIGEASNRLSDDFKVQHPEVSWNEIRGFRNRLIHEYFGIDFELVWVIVKNEIPGLLDQLKSWRGLNQ